MTPRPFWAQQGQEHCRAVEVSKDKASSSYTELWLGSGSRQRPGGGRDGVGLERLVQDLVPGDSEHRGFCSGGVGLREGEGLQPGAEVGTGSNGASRAQVWLAPVWARQESSELFHLVKFVVPAAA